MKAKEVEAFGARVTIFENSDIFISTRGDVGILNARDIRVSKGRVTETEPIPPITRVVKGRDFTIEQHYL